MGRTEIPDIKNNVLEATWLAFLYTTFVTTRYEFYNDGEYFGPLSLLFFIQGVVAHHLGFLISGTLGLLTLAAATHGTDTGSLTVPFMACFFVTLIIKRIEDWCESRKRPTR